MISAVFENTSDFKKITFEQIKCCKQERDEFGIKVFSCSDFLLVQRSRSQNTISKEQIRAFDIRVWGISQVYLRSD